MDMQEMAVACNHQVVHEPSWVKWHTVVSTAAIINLFSSLKKAKNCDSWRKKTGKILFFSNFISSRIKKDKFMCFPFQWICHCTFFVLLMLKASFSLWKQPTFENFKPVREQRCHYSYWWVPVLSRTISCSERLALLLVYILFGSFLLLYRRVCYCCPGIFTYVILKFGTCFVSISRRLKEIQEWSNGPLTECWYLESEQHRRWIFLLKYLCPTLCARLMPFDMILKIGYRSES